MPTSTRIGSNARVDAVAAGRHVRHQQVGRPSDGLLQRPDGERAAARRASSACSARWIEHELVERIDRPVGEGGVADLAGVGRAALDRDAELEQARREGLDLAHADARFGGMEIDRGIGAQSAMQERRDAARMALAGRAGEDDVARRHLARFEHGLQALHQDGHARQIVGHAPAMEAAVVDHAGEGVALPAFGVGQRLAVGMGEEDDASTFAAAPLKVATTLSRSSVSIARALANSPTIGTSAGL